MSFQTAADNEGTSHEESGDDEDGEYENDPDYDGPANSQPHQDTAIDAAPVGTPGLTMSSDDDEGNKSGETLNKTPLTEKEEGEIAPPAVAASTPVTSRKTPAIAPAPLSPVGIASRRMSRMTSTNSSMDGGSEYNSSRRTYLDPLPSGRRDDRYRSQSERGTSGNKVSRNSRMLLPSSDYARRPGPASSRGSILSGRRGPASVSDHDHGSSRNSYMLALPSRRHDDNLSIASRRSRATSTTSRMLDSESQVFAGTRIRRYIEPSLTDAMRRVMKQFSASGAAHLDDHRCIGYPIAVFVGATAIDVGSIINPVISGAVALYFAPGHPKNMAALLPPEDRVPAHIPNPKAPNTTSLSRRAELRSAITALHTVYELYRGRACAHVCIDSAYVAKAWGTWIPTWEAEGWPGLDEEDYSDRERWEDDYYERSERRRGNRRGGRRDGYGSEGRRYRSRRDFGGRDDRRRHNDDDYSSEEEAFRRDQRRRRRGDDSYDESEDDLRSPRYSSASDRRPLSRAPGRRLVDEDLLRELADIRYEFGRIEHERLGSAHVYLLDRSHNPADKMARAVARNEAQMVQQLGSEAEAIGLDIDEAELSDPEGQAYDEDEQEDEWADTRSRLSKNSRLTATSATRSQSARNGNRRSTSNSTRNSITSNATSRVLRNSASAPAVRGQQRRQLDTFAEEDEYNLSNESAGLAGVGAGTGSRLDLPTTNADSRSLRSDRSKRSTRAERERDEYLARQQEAREQEQQTSRQSRDLPRTLLNSGSRLLGLPTSFSERGGGAGRRSMDVESSRRSVDVDPRRTSLDSRRRTSLSQPDLRNRFASQPPSETVRGALASAATRDTRRSFQLPEDRHRSLRGSASAHGHGSRNAQRDFDEEDEFDPPRGTRPSRLGKSSKQSLTLADPPAVFNRKIASRSTPSLHRTPAPEDDDYDWSRSPKKPTATSKSRTSKAKKTPRQWHSTTAPEDLDAEDDHQQLRKKQSFFGRLFSRKSKA